MFRIVERVASISERSVAVKMGETVDVVLVELVVLSDY